MNGFHNILKTQLFKRRMAFDLFCEILPNKVKTQSLTTQSEGDIIKMQQCIQSEDTPRKNILSFRKHISLHVTNDDRKTTLFDDFVVSQLVRLFSSRTFSLAITNFLTVLFSFPQNFVQQLLDYIPTGFLFCPETICIQIDGE